MRGIGRSVLCIALVLAASRAGAAAALDALYTSQAIVTGTGATNRQPGFRDCLERVLVRVSGDQRIVQKPAMAGLLAQAGRFVSSFTYRDRLAGKPVHDEQGTHDRPHDLTCHYRQADIDALLAGLGSRPWLAPRPVLKVSLTVERNGQKYRVDARSGRDQAMRQSFEQAASPLAMQVVFPPAEVGDADPHAVSPPPADGAPGSVMPMSGSLVWSDPDLGWVGTWQLVDGTGDHRWQVRGVNFDEAFRVAVRGAAQILSGHGAP